MDRREAEAHVNSSYTFFFGISAIALAFIFSNSFGELRNKSWLIILGFALVTYFLWDFIKQLYSPDQAFLLYCLIFIVLPFVGSLSLGYIQVASFIVWLGASITAGILELIYEYGFKSIAPKSITKRLLIVDNKIDKSIVTIYKKQMSVYSIRGVIFAVLLITTYYLATYLLLR